MIKPSLDLENAVMTMKRRTMLIYFNFLADKGYDDTKLIEWLENRGILFLCAQ